MASQVHKLTLLLLVAVIVVIYCSFNLQSNHSRDFTSGGEKTQTSPFMFSKRFQTEKRRVVIIGAGVTGLGAAHRLYELGILRTNTQVVILDQQVNPGGLASSYRDAKGFLWDNGGHVVYSHYRYFDNVLNKAVKEWNSHKRAAFAFMKGSSGKRKFLPYPVQDNIMAMDETERNKILQQLQQIINEPTSRKPRNFDDWLLMNFGEELCNVFMRKYNRKVWTVDTKQMNAAWVGERVAVPSIAKINANAVNMSDSQWGPNRWFRFPKYHGTGGIWTAVANLLPPGWIHTNHKVTKIDLINKKLKVVVGNVSLDNYYNLNYDVLISTAPLDLLINMTRNPNAASTVSAKDLTKYMLYSKTHIIGIGLKGKAPKHLADKSWMYFPDSDSPFYRVTVFSKYSHDHVPKKGLFWSLMCETAEPLKHTGYPKYWTRDSILDKTILALVEYGFITKDKIVSKYYRKLDHGYPIPYLKREQILKTVQPWLESNGIFSRGRFGGWRYEVSNQDHSFMQGVEVVDRIMRGIPEETYPNPNLVNSMKASGRHLVGDVKSTADYEIVIAHFNENLDWIINEASHVHVYHKGKMEIPDLRFQQWERLPNVGRESHTYLYHIIHNYRRLADVTVFLQGSTSVDTKENEHCFSNVKDYVGKALKESYAVKAPRGYLRKWGRLAHYGKWREQLQSGKIRRSKYTIGEMWERAIGSPHPAAVRVSFKGCFAATRERIHFRSLNVYKRLISFIDNHPNPEEGHYFERLWHGIFFGS